MSNRVIPAADAHAVARITYRQLDHWARQGWVTPSVDPGHGRSARRLYTEADVIRLDLLRHLALSGVNPAAAGPHLGTVDVAEGMAVLWGPVGQRGTEPGFKVVPASELHAAVTAGGAWVVYDGRDEVLSRLAVVAAGEASTDTTNRRLA